MMGEATNVATLAQKKTVIAPGSGGEMDHDLGYPPGAAKPAIVTCPTQNSTGAKTVLTERAEACRSTTRPRRQLLASALFPYTSTLRQFQLQDRRQVHLRHDRA
jgi:hypothetical protein